MATQTTLTFGGDADALAKASAKARASVEGVGEQAQRTSGDLTDGARAAQEHESRLTRLGATSAGTSAAIGDLGGTMSSVNDLMNRGADRAMEQARALADLEQAQLDSTQAAIDLEQAQSDVGQALLDVKQAGRDAAQAQIDVEQAQLDAAAAAADYAAAVKEHGKNSLEARQALIDQKQAQEDLKQAQLDAEQATHDQGQAQIDAKQYTNDAAQAQRDAADAALNMADAQRAANPGTLATVARDAELISGVMAGAAGAVNLLAMAHGALSLAALRAGAATAAARVATVAGTAATGIATAAQWLWNVALSANPIGLIIIAVAALVAGIVWVATKTTWFQTIWKVVWAGIVAYFRFQINLLLTIWRIVWGGIVAYFRTQVTIIKAIFSAIATAGAWLWDKIKAMGAGIRDVFTGIGAGIKGAFVGAFNWISRAWNGTVGQLRWSVPSWVPGIGGSEVAAPTLPTYETGTRRVPGAPGQAMLALLHAGERVTPARAASAPAVVEFRSDGSELGDLLVKLLERAIRNRGGLQLGATRG